MTRKNDKLMAMLSIWGIILVVLGHSGFTNATIEEKLAGLQKWIYSFHMPLFFFISGYLYSLTNKSFDNINFRKFLSKKVKRLLLPYFVLGVIVFVIKYTFASLSCITRNFSLKSFLYMFLAPHAPDSTMGFLWYLLTLFLIFVIVTILPHCKVNLKNVRHCILVMIISWTLTTFLTHINFLNLSKLFWYLPFFICGIIFCNVNGEKKLSTSIRSTLIFSILSGGGQLLLIFGNLAIPGIIKSILAAMAGIVFLITICSYLLRYNKLSTFLLAFASQVYSIYLLSWFGQYPIQILTINFLHLNWTICAISIFIAGIIFPLTVHLMVSKIAFLRNSKILTLAIGY